MVEWELAIDSSPGKLSNVFVTLLDLIATYLRISWQMPLNVNFIVIYLKEYLYEAYYSTLAEKLTSNRGPVNKPQILLLS